jgi:hypothetical protein
MRGTLMSLPATTLVLFFAVTSTTAMAAPTSAHDACWNQYYACVKSCGAHTVSPACHAYCTLQRVACLEAIAPMSVNRDHHPIYLPPRPSTSDKVDHPTIHVP